MKVLTRLIALLIILTFPFLNSHAQAPLALSMSEAIERALRYNLGVASSTQEERVRGAERAKALYDMYPKVAAQLAAVQQQINLAAFGFSGFPGVSSVVGPFSLVDARARMTQSVFDRKLVHDLREARENEHAATFATENTREIVVLTVANFYLQALSAASRISAVEAQVARAQGLYNRALDLKNSGLVAGIDVLRAQVELQTQQQRLLAFRNDFALLKLNLVRAIGAPLTQEITLTDAMPVDTPPSPRLEEALQIAMENRQDLRRADSLVRAAQHALDSARSESLPTLDFDSDYGAIGRSPGQSHGTYSMRGQINIPIFNRNETRSDRLEAEARLKQRVLEADDLRAQVEMDIRAAYLELNSAGEQVRVAQSSLTLARQQLDQAQDRFEAGIAGNLEVVQAQETVALADENVISSLYAFNVGKARLARAMGTAQQTLKAFFGGTR
jgi:outer membrane protein TolC